MMQNGCIEQKLKWRILAMTATRKLNMPSLKTLSASAKSAAKPSAQATKATKTEKPAENGKECVNSFEQLKDLVRA